VSTPFISRITPQGSPINNEKGDAEKWKRRNCTPSEFDGANDSTDKGDRQNDGCTTYSHIPARYNGQKHGKKQDINDAEPARGFVRHSSDRTDKRGPF